MLDTCWKMDRLCKLRSNMNNSMEKSQRRCLHLNMQYTLCNVYAIPFSLLEISLGGCPKNELLDKYIPPQISRRMYVCIGICTALCSSCMICLVRDSLSSVTKSNITLCAWDFKNCRIKLMQDSSNFPNLSETHSQASNIPHKL